jgi:hypothetical protein
MSDQVFDKILIPMLRRVIPSLIAAEIVGVQPMSGYNFNRKSEFILFPVDRPRINSKMISVHTAIRPFMRSGDTEPNEHYRPWLEEHIGEQGVNWNWDIHSVTENTLAIYFAESEQASLFELTWP